VCATALKLSNSEDLDIMPIEILMPALSPTMTEGNLARWLIKEGDKVKPGMVIAEIETDKATMEVEAVDGGILGKILVPAGAQEVKVNALIALVLEDGEDAKILDSYAAKEAPTTAAPAAPVAPVATTSSPAAPTPMAATTTSAARIATSPLAKRLAQDAGLDLRALQGTGPHGRIIKADILEAIEQGTGRGRTIRRNEQLVRAEPLSMMRKVIAKRLLESKQTIPHFYLSVPCQLDRLLEMRSEINDATPKEKPAYKLSVNDFVIKAVAMALADVPAANSAWSDEAMLYYTNIDVAVAVAIEGGLITPIIANADQKSVIQISSEMKDLAARARDNKLRPEEFQGGSFSISNLGMFGIEKFSAIINPPQACILAVGAGSKRPVVHEDTIDIATVMDVTLSCDHRVVDGAVAAQFLNRFQHYIEHPLQMLLSSLF
jgi:pyruvate dehydrogenase E2 component (dihydrolipoamide acetyltransferase)